MSAPKDNQQPSPFIDPRELPKMKLADGTEVTLKPGKWKKSRRVTNFSRYNR
jgi:hypothetical protein